MSKIILMAESGSDISPELAKEFCIVIVPMHVAFGGETRDDGSFPVTQMFDHYKNTHEPPRTSGCTPIDFEHVFEKLDQEEPDKQILYLAYSAVTTCSMQSGVIASEGRSDIRIIDTKAVSAGQCAVVLRVARALKANPDIKVALLDVMLPDIDGFEVCRRIRAMDNKIGIIMLTARSQEMDKVTGLMTGADDYVTKPFSPAELTARVDALFRRAGGAVEEQSGEISQPPFLLNTRNRTLEKNGQRVKLTQVEYSIMKMFMENPGKALSREEILELVWGRDYFGELKIVDVNIRRLRLKIEDNATNPAYITTVWGYGYKWGF